MRAFSDEKKMGTLELLLTKPISFQSIILAKYFAAVLLILTALIPTLLYILTISSLGNPMGNFDLGSTIGSYIGLVFLVLAYAAIGIFSSTLSSNQIVAFIIAIFICFALYYGFEGLTSLLNSDFSLENLGMKAHFDSTTRGVVDTRDIIYFLSISVFFLVSTVFKLRNES
jgi:ABC-2 type transport system permease protein